jgi:hypothetical protein
MIPGTVQVEKNVGVSALLTEAWAVHFECGLPVRRFTARKGQRPGRSAPALR